MSNCPKYSKQNSTESPDRGGVYHSSSAGLKNFKVKNRPQARRKRRRGSAVVEFALIAPLFFLLVLGMVEWGRMVMVQQVITNASREGARRAVLDGMSTSDVQTAVESYLSDASITGATITVTEIAAVPPDFAPSMEVQVSIPFADVSWLPSPMSLAKWLPTATSLDTLTLSATTTMRKEAVQ